MVLRLCVTNAIEHNVYAVMRCDTMVSRTRHRARIFDNVPLTGPPI